MFSTESNWKKLQFLYSQLKRAEKISNSDISNLKEQKKSSISLFSIECSDKNL